MADEIYGALVAIVFSMGAMFYAALMVRRWHFRNHVWVELRLNKGEKDLFLCLPEKDGSLETAYGRYVPSPNVPFEMFNGGWHNGGKKQIFSFYQGDPRPIRYTQTYVFVKPTHEQGASTNGGTRELMKVSVAGHQVIPAETLSVFMKQKLFGDIYQKKELLIMILLLGMFVLFVMMLILLARGG